MKLTQPQKQTIVAIGIWGVKASVGITVASNLSGKGFIEFDNAYNGWFLTDKGMDAFCYFLVDYGMDPYGDDLPDYVKNEVKQRFEKWLT